MQIHQLNEFVGPLDSSAQLAVDNGEDTGKLAFTDLFAGNSFKTLWTGAIDKKDDVATLSAPVTDFDFIDIYYAENVISNVINMRSVRVPSSAESARIQHIYAPVQGGLVPNAALEIAMYKLALSGSTVTIDTLSKWAWDGTTGNAPTCVSLTTGSFIKIVRIDGIITPGNTKGVIIVKPITLAAADWAANEQTVTVDELKATSDVIISPVPAGMADYIAAGIYCDSQAAGELTFICSTTPSNNIVVNIAILG